MLSLFPEILFLAPVATFAIRISVALLLALAGREHFTKRESLLKAFAVLEVVLAASLAAGAWTQAVALFALLALGAGLFYPRLRFYPVSTVALALVMAATLVVTGPGAIALDLPL